MKQYALGFFITTIFLVGCSQPQLSPFQTDKRFESVMFEGDIPLRGMKSISPKGEKLYVFIEGDGRAWIRRDLPSLDPTPKNPIGWIIASTSFQNDTLYLSRPCQYLSDTERSACTQNDWTDGRFSVKLIDVMNRAIDTVMAKGGYQKLVLGGYSGGGTMALLIALRRSDIEEVITVASPIDIDAWSRYHGVSRLSGSLNPIRDMRSLSKIKQRHYVGGEDKIVPPSLVYEALSHYSHPSPAQVIEMDGFDHTMQGFRIPSLD